MCELSRDANVVLRQIAWRGREALGRAYQRKTSVERNAGVRLGARLALDSGTLTPLLKRLEAARLVTRTRDAADERRVLVSLTDSGRALRQRAEHIPEQMLCATQCPVEEIQALTQRLHALRSSLEQARTDSSLPD